MTETAQVVVIGSDNEAETKKIMQGLLEAGYTVILADSVEQGMQIIHDLPIDLVIMRRDPSWTETDDRLLQFRRETDVALLVLGDRQYMPETLESGADSYIYPPVAMDELAAKAGAVIRRVKGREWNGVPQTKTEDGNDDIAVN